MNVSVQIYTATSDKTVSIIDFESTLLDSYDSRRSYRIVYPDGSER